MSNKKFVEILESINKKVKSFIFSVDIFAFLIFLLISTIFWVVISLNRQYENIYTFPIKYCHIPEGMEYSADMTSDIEVKLKDKGGVLLTQVGTRHDSLIFDFTKHTEIGKADKILLPTSTTFEKQLKAIIPSSTQIIEYYPSEIIIEKGALKSKTVPIALSEDITCDGGFCLGGEIQIRPEKAKIYASQDIIDDIDTIYTELIEKHNLTDTLTTTVKLILPEKCKSNVQDVEVFIPVEITVEGSTTVPVSVINVPPHYHIKTIPQEVTVKYNIGRSKYNKISSSDFKVTLDYNDIIDSHSKLQFVEIKKAPKSVLNCKLSPESVEYIVY